VQCHRCRDQSWTPKHSFWSRCGQIGVRIRRHSWPPLVTKARFWVSNQMRPTGAGAVYPAAAADGIHRREVNFRLEYESEREVSGRQRALSQHGSTAGHGHPRTGDITAFVGSQQHVHRCELGRLARAAKWWSSPKFATFSSGMVAGIKGVQIGPGATLFTQYPSPPTAAPSSPKSSRRKNRRRSAQCFSCGMSEKRRDFGVRSG